MSEKKDKKHKTKRERNYWFNPNEIELQNFPPDISAKLILDVKNHLRNQYVIGGVTGSGNDSGQPLYNCQTSEWIVTYNGNLSNFYIPPDFLLSCDLVFLTHLVTEKKVSHPLIIFDDQPGITDPWIRIKNSEDDSHTNESYRYHLSQIPDICDKLLALIRQRSSSRLFGLVLTGGKSERMKVDKASLHYKGKSQLAISFELLANQCEQTFISCRAEQTNNPLYQAFPQIHDKFIGMGPMSGILSALEAHPQTAWLVLACDLPFVEANTLSHLLNHRDTLKTAAAYRSFYDQMPEPLCAIYEPKAYQLALGFVAQGFTCPRKFLINSNIRLLDLIDEHALDNINHPEEYENALKLINMADDK